MIKVGVVSLGCDKNRVDSEVMLKKLSEKYVVTSSPEEADVIIVNTCAFLESSRKEAIDTVFEMAKFKKAGNKKIIVTGCLGEKFGKEVFAQLSEADAVLGTNDYDSIVGAVEAVVAGERCYCVSHCETITHGERILTTPSHYAYLKIADGCNNFCTYCLIPHIRGRFRSLPVETVVSEAKQLVQSGVRELILVAQDTTRYGLDLYGQPKISELLHELSAIDGLQWIRLLYCYPELVTDELIAEITNNEKIVKCLDIPLQHVNDVILKRMNRHSDGQSIRKLFSKLKSAGIEVRSTFICGFPGETDATVTEMQEFLKQYQLRNVGFFAFSPEEGTPAYNFEGGLSTRKKQSIVNALYKTQFNIVLALNAGDVGKTYNCIVDQFVKHEGAEFVYCARTQFQAPEIDGVVYVHSSKKLANGDIVNVKITNVLEYDLIGDVLL